MNPFNDILGMGKEIGFGLADAKTYCRPRIQKTNKVRVIAPDNPQDKYNLLTPQRVSEHFERYKDEFITQYDKPQQSDNVFKNEKISSCKLSSADIKFIRQDAEKWDKRMNPLACKKYSSTDPSECVCWGSPSSSPSVCEPAPHESNHLDHAQITHEMRTAAYSLDQIPIKIEADMNCAKSGPAQQSFRTSGFTKRLENHSYNISCQTMASHCQKVQNTDVKEAFQHDVKSPEFTQQTRTSISNTNVERNTNPHINRSKESFAHALASSIADKQIQKEKFELTPESRNIENFEHSQTTHSNPTIREKNQLTPGSRNIENFEHTQTTHSNPTIREKNQLTPGSRNIENFEHTQTTHSAANIKHKNQLTPGSRNIENFEHSRSNKSNNHVRFRAEDTNKMSVTEGINREDFAHIYQNGNARPY